eukprot:gene13196-13327_t
MKEYSEGQALAGQKRHSSNFDERMDQVRNCSDVATFLWEVASHANGSYLLDDVLQQLLVEKSCLPAGQANGLQNVLFVVMGSADLKERLLAQTESWLAWVPPANVVLLSDAPVQGLNVTVLPQLPADEVIAKAFHGKQPTNYEKANLRCVKSIQWMGKHNKAALQGIDWVFMIDDDTFVNIPLLELYLRRFSPAFAVSIGHVWDWPPGTSPSIMPGLVYLSGGAGMLFSRPAIEQLAQVVFEPECPTTQYDGVYLNDISLGLCSVVANVTKVHSLLFLTADVHVSDGNRFEDIGRYITRHRATTRAMMLQYTCVVSKRYGWPHHLCGDAHVRCDPVCIGLQEQKARGIIQQ